MCQDLQGNKGKVSFMNVIRRDYQDYEYYPVEMYKTPDCTGETLMVGLTRGRGEMIIEYRKSDTSIMRGDEWGGMVQSLKVHKDLNFFTYSDLYHQEDYRKYKEQ